VHLEILIRKPESKCGLGRSRHGLEDNMKMNSKAMACEDMSGIHLPQGRD
jgi:hypothetical protein